MKIPNALLKFLPADVKQEVEQALALLDNDAIAKDLEALLAAMQSSLKGAAGKTISDNALKNAFNEAADVAALGKKIIHDKKVSLFDTPKLLSAMKNGNALGEAFAKAFEKKQPEMMSFLASLEQNDAFSKALQSLNASTKGTLIDLQDGPTGGTLAIPMFGISLPLPAQYYAQLKKVLNAGNAGGGTGPSHKPGA